MDHLQRVKREFSRQADHFATSAAITNEQLTARFIAAAGPHATGAILDLACGPGIITSRLATTAHEVVAFDLTPEMLAKARQRCAAARLSNVTFKEGSATDLPFAEKTFDAVVTRLSIHHFEDPDRVIGESWRVLKPGGMFVLADVVSSEIADRSSLHNAIEVLRDPSHVRMLPASELVSRIEGAGFCVESRSEWDMPRDFDEWSAIVDDPARVAPLRTIVQALAQAGVDAGIGLTIADGTIAFFHRWSLIGARKPMPETQR